MESLNNIRKALFQCCRSCLCQSDRRTEMENEENGDNNTVAHKFEDVYFVVYHPMHSVQFAMAYVERPATAKHRYTACTPRCTGPETLETIRKAIEALEKINDDSIEDDEITMTEEIEVRV